jgi:hypothetical protein
MAGFFVCLSIPILIFILLYNYHRNSETIIVILHDDVAKTSRASIENVEAMIGGVAATLRLLAEVTAANPNFFRTDRSNDVLFRALTTADEIDAAVVSFEDGYHRAVTRIDDDRRRSDQNPAKRDLAFEISSTTFRWVKTAVVIGRFSIIGGTSSANTPFQPQPTTEPHRIFGGEGNEDSGGYGASD